MPGEITSALRRIKSQNVNIIDDKAKVCAMLNDLEPSMGKERRRVRLLYETGAIHSVAKAVSNPESARLYLSQAVSILTDQADMNEGAAAETVNYFTPLWNLPPVDAGSKASGTLDTDAIFEMMAKADSEKKAKSPKQQNKGSARNRSPVYGQQVQSSPQQNPAFNQPLKRAGRLYGAQSGTQQSSQSYQPKPRRIYGSAAKNASSQTKSSQTASARNYGINASAAASSASTSAQGGTGLFSQRRRTPSWKNVAIKVKQNSGSASAVTPLAAAQQAAEDLCRFYSQQLAAASGNDIGSADRLCRKAILLTAIAPAKASRYFVEAAASGDVSHLSLIGRQILAWQNYLDLEEAMGFACLQMAVDRGAENGAYALAHCYHTGTGILYCKELAEKYYHQAAARHPEITEQINRRLNQLHNGQMPTDTLWRYY